MNVLDLIEEADKLEDSFHINIELPNTDAYRWLCCGDDVRSFAKQHGNVEVEFDNGCRVFRVPEFLEGRKTAIEAKRIDCLRWGCE